MRGDQEYLDQSEVKVQLPGPMILESGASGN